MSQSAIVAVVVEQRPLLPSGVVAGDFKVVLTNSDTGVDIDSKLVAESDIGSPINLTLPDYGTYVVSAARLADDGTTVIGDKVVSASLVYAAPVVAPVAAPVADAPVTAVDTPVADPVVAAPTQTTVSDVPVLNQAAAPVLASVAVPITVTVTLA